MKYKHNPTVPMKPCGAVGQTIATMNKELKAKLDALVERFNTPAFIENDPVKFPRMFTERQDIEVAAFLCALIAWGNRKQILNGCQKMLFDIMEGQP